MDASFIFMIIIWAFFEIVGLLMKKEFQVRMRYGAIGATIIVVGGMADGMYRPDMHPVFTLLGGVLLYGTITCCIYFLRLITSNVTTRRAQSKKYSKTKRIIIRTLSQFIAIVLGFGIGSMIAGVAVGVLYLSAN